MKLGSRKDSEEAQQCSSRPKKIFNESREDEHEVSIVPRSETSIETNKSNDRDNAVFIDVTEAGVAANRAKGFKTPGWYVYHTSNGRHYAECLVPMKVSASDAGDAGVTGTGDDSIAADS